MIDTDKIEKKRDILLKLAALICLTFSISYSKIVTIAVAANVSYAIQELKREFSKIHPEIEIRAIIGSSGKLTAQIRNGAPYDLFMAANMAYPRRLRKSGEAITEPKIYAKGALALFSPLSRDLAKGLAALLSPDIRRIAIANPKAAPYGQAAEEALKKSGLYEKVRPKLIYGESISQTLAYTLKAADIGIVAKSSLLAPGLRHYKRKSNWIDVNPDFYTPIKQGIVILKHARKNPDAKAFQNFILGKKARKIFKSYGYLLP